MNIYQFMFHISNRFVIACYIQIVIRTLKNRSRYYKFEWGYLMVKLDLVYK